MGRGRGKGRDGGKLNEFENSNELELLERWRNFHTPHFCLKMEDPGPAVWHGTNETDFCLSQTNRKLIWLYLKK